MVDSRVCLCAKLNPVKLFKKTLLLLVLYQWCTVSQWHMAPCPEGLHLVLRISIISPTDARVTHPFGSGSIPASAAKESRHRVTVSGLTILHNPLPAGRKELTDLISRLNNCRTVWHVADLDICECVCVFESCSIYETGSDSKNRWSIAGLKWNIFSAFHSLKWMNLGCGQRWTSYSSGHATLQNISTCEGFHT